MRESWLIQRLHKPTRPHALPGVDNPFAFGGGLKNGGLSDEAMGLLRGIFSFDYMGSAEFEFGAVPETLSKLAKAKRLAAFTLTVPLADVPAHWKDKSKTKPKGDAAVYALCDASESDAVWERIVALATDKQAQYLKESTHLASSLRPFDEWDGETCGWLELDNGFFFFTDREMWAATAELFGVDVAESADA